MKNPFEKIKVIYLYTLCKVISESEIHRLDFIKTIYLESAVRFDETLFLLEALNIVKNESEELILTKPIYDIHQTIVQFKDKFLAILLTVEGYLFNYLIEFLSNFRLEQGKYIFDATPLENIKFSEIRNLLLELEFISIEDNRELYIVNPNYSKLFLHLFTKRTISLKSLKSILSQNEELGLKGELAVIDYEKNRLKNIPLQPNEIEHVSQINVSAGYDIKSFEDFLDSNCNRVERFIEVKVVSTPEYSFFWSRNEIEISRFFADRYYLYLLPITSKNVFDFEKIRIVVDPYKNVYLNQNEWDKKEEIVSFCRKAD